MEIKPFQNEAMVEEHPNWEKATKRNVLYSRSNDIRSAFARDYNRIIHCTAYRRLKHKTQVFFAVQNDHICTRIEHVQIVASVSYTIANNLGLNTELTQAIATGHDLGHAPFGHAAEVFLDEISQKELGKSFWHEKNGLRYVDLVETLEDPDGKFQNLNLTYGVRDGIISHCGEVDENGLKPRSEAIDLATIEEKNQYAPYTWEACVVKIADKIAYLARDIEDAEELGILDKNLKNELINITKADNEQVVTQINNTILMHDFIIDLCENSSPERGLSLSSASFQLMNSIKEFNYERIYKHARLNNYKKYAKVVIETIYQVLMSFYAGEDTIAETNKHRKFFPELVNSFVGWLTHFSTYRIHLEYSQNRNKILYDLRDKKSYTQAVIDYISGMTDSFAIRVFQETISFK